MQQENQPKKIIIIDTDCGIDDALALMLALTTETCKIIGVTCCGGNTSVENVCQNVMRVLTICESRAPIYKGCSKPLRVTEHGGHVHGDDGFGGAAHLFPTGEFSIEEEYAPVALLKLSKEYKGQITLVTLGPLTNIALAQRLDSQFTTYLKEIFIMGGNLYGLGNSTVTAEFNFYCDPEAALIVISEAECPITVTPWETCLNHGMQWDFRDKWLLKDTKKSYFVKKIFENLTEFCRKNGDKTLTDCDFMCMATAIIPSVIVETTTCITSIELEGHHTRGQTIIDRRDGIKIQNPFRNVHFIAKMNDDVLNNLRTNLVL